VQANKINIIPNNSIKEDVYSISINLDTNDTEAGHSAIITIVCNKNKIDIEVTQRDKATNGKVHQGNRNVDVYVAGYERHRTPDQIKHIALYWKNGEKIVLGKHDSYAESIIVVENDIYIAGYELNTDIYDPSTNTPYGYDAKYWKNGQEIILGDGKKTSYAKSIYVSGSDVYVAGYEINTYSMRNGDKNECNNWYYTPVCWKNGKAITLENSNPADSSGRPVDYQANYVFMSGNDVYVGCENVCSKKIRYWKNGKEIVWDCGHSPVNIESMYISGNDVYIAGSFECDGYHKAAYWKNGNKAVLGKNNANSVINAIYVSGNEVYVAGMQDDAHTDDRAAYWKNGERIDLKEGINTSSIFILDGITYVAGNKEDEYGPTCHARYWVNGEKILLDNEETGTGTWATSIFVVKK